MPPSIALRGVDWSLSNEQVSQGVLCQSRGLLSNLVRSRFSPENSFCCQGICPNSWIFNSSVEVQPTHNVYLYHMQDILDCFLSKQRVRVECDVIYAARRNL